MGMEGINSVKHKFELVKSTQSQRFYKLPKRIDKADRCESIAKLLLDLDPLKFIEGVSLAEDLSSGIEYVCISDAHAHIERLVFPAFMVTKNGETVLSHRNNQIGGKVTMMIHGGDPDSVYPDEVYLRRLMMLNP
jgi:hypothetical protein